LRSLLREFLSELKILLAPVLLVVTNIFIFVPFTVYKGNHNEFEFGFIDLLTSYVFSMFAVVTILYIAVFIISRRNKSLCVSLIMAVGVLLWLQSNFLVWNYGVFDGQGIQWNEFPWQGCVDIFFWSVVMLFAIVYRNKLFELSTFVCVCFILLQLGVLSFFFLTNYNIGALGKPYQSTIPPSLYEYSFDNNIIHVILDGMQTDVFLEILREENLSSDFDGFTIFNENLSTDLTTTLTVPAIFSGKRFEGNSPVSEYYEKNLVDNGFQNRLKEEGYNLSLIPILPMPNDVFAYYEIPSVYNGSEEQVKVRNAIRLMEISMFRMVPQFLKKHIYQDENWLLTSMFSEVPTHKSVQHNIFFKDYIKSIEVSRNNPAYHFVHLYSTHPPYVYDGKGEYQGKSLSPTRDNFKNQAFVATKLTVEYLKKLKSLGVYNSSLIIVQADHGQGFVSHGRYFALLAVKPPHSEGPMQVSQAHTMITDIPATIMEYAKIKANYPGENVFDIVPGKDRIRIVNISKTDRYIVKGSAYNTESWKRQSINQSEFMESLIYKWGDVIDFSLTGDAEKYQLAGWSNVEKDFTWTDGNRAVLNLPIQDTMSDVILTAKFHPLFYKDKFESQDVTILINGKKIDKWELRQGGICEREVFIPNSLLGNSINLELQLHDAVSPNSLGISGDRRQLGLAFYSIQLKEVEK